MPSWSAIIGFILDTFGWLLFYFALAILQGAWAAAEEGPERVRKMSELLAAVCYCILASFLMVACRNEIVSLYRHHPFLFWAVAGAFLLALGKWWWVIQEHSDRSRDSGFPDL